MHIERKIATAILSVVAAAAAFAVVLPNQTSPVKKGQSNSSNQPVAGAFDSIKPNEMQSALFEIISWEQSVALAKMGGHPLPDYSKMSSSTKAARQEVVYACNFYYRATLKTDQAKEFDRTIWDVKTHPLPEKWTNFRAKGLQVDKLIVPEKDQGTKAWEIINRFRDRNHAVWGKPEGINGGYERHLRQMIEEFRAILTTEQLKEFDSHIGAYQNEVRTALESADRP